MHQLEYSVYSSDDLTWDEINDNIKVNLYRIIQEASLNSIKHAKASYIEISFFKENDFLHLTILDDGIGFDTKKKHKGIGLKNIHSRTTKLQGKLNIYSEQNKGSDITVIIPI